MVKHRTLSRDKVLSQANQLIAQNGVEKLTIRAVATALDVRPQSIYNYAASLNDLVDQVGLRFVQDLTERLWAQLVGISGQAALLAFAREIRRTCQRHPNLAALLLKPSALEALPRTHAALIQLYQRLFASLHLDETAPNHLAEVTLYRSAVFGFIVQELGGFLKGSPAQLDQRFDQTLHLAIAQLKLSGGPTA